MNAETKGAHAENGQPIVPGGRVTAVHFAAPTAPGPWGGPPLLAIVCGHPVAADPDRFTKDTRKVTCADCRMHPAFAAARTDARRLRLVTP